MIIDKSTVEKGGLVGHGEYLDHGSKSEGFHQVQDPDGLMVMAPTSVEFVARVLTEGKALGAETDVGAISLAISPGEGEMLGNRDWTEVIHIALEVHGWDDSPRNAKLHDKERPVSKVTGLAALPQHMHLDVAGYEPVTGLRRSLYKFNERGEMAARCIENFLGHRHVLGNHAQANERELRRLAEIRTEFDRPLSYDPAATAAGIREEAARQLRDAGHDPSDDPDKLMAAWTKHCSPRQLRTDPARKAQVEGINMDRIAAALLRAWSEMQGVGYLFPNRCRAYGLELTRDKHGRVLALDGEGKDHSLEACLNHAKRSGLDQKKPVDVPALLAALSKVRLPSLPEARRKAIPETRKAYTTERSTLGKRLGRAKLRKDQAAVTAIQAEIEALDRRSLPLFTSPGMKPPAGAEELRMGNIHVGSNLPEGLLVRGEGPVDCDRAVEAFVPRMTSKTLVIDIRGGRRDVHLELTRSAMKRGLKVEGGYETQTPGFEMLPAPKAKPVPAVLEKPIVVEQPKPQARDEDIIVQLPPKVRPDPARSPIGENSIVVRGDGAPMGDQLPMAARSIPRAEEEGKAREVKTTDAFTAFILKRNDDLKEREARRQARAAAAEAPQPVSPPKPPAIAAQREAALPEPAPATVPSVGLPCTAVSSAAASIAAPKAEVEPAAILARKDAKAEAPKTEISKAAPPKAPDPSAYAKQRGQHERVIQFVDHLIATKCEPKLEALKKAVLPLHDISLGGRSIKRLAEDMEKKEREKPRDPELTEEEYKENIQEAVASRFIKELMRPTSPRATEVIGDKILPQFEAVLRTGEALLDALSETQRESRGSGGFTEKQFAVMKEIFDSGCAVAKQIDIPAWMDAVSTVLKERKKDEPPAQFSQPLDIAGLAFALEFNLNRRRLDRRNDEKPFPFTDEELERLHRQPHRAPAVTETAVVAPEDPELVRQRETLLLTMEGLSDLTPESCGNMTSQSCGDVPLYQGVDGTLYGANGVWKPEPATVAPALVQQPAGAKEVRGDTRPAARRTHLQQGTR
ncbi:hypothetical protein [Sabulicella glaciei]|uniref:Large polyvalent protein-associated domain-containing protein n=1 Tax=Sabulicella glaciei TaxID=2984948 RepID=A0ABT3P3Y4_9PROT|nr:hypothetical protein [Roseococcus sp. MDT2-1-1]MCW8088479.1 hypothetical protein [Roseococcus sp. MDT2-1-1]